MLNVAVWMDTENAQIFTMDGDVPTKSTLNKTGVAHHTTNAKDHHGNSDQEHFYRDLAEHLKNASKLLLMGPGLGKNHFVTHLETHHTNGLAKKIIATETSDHLTDNQIVAKARPYFA